MRSLLALSILALAAGLETKDGSARVPVLGWNSWNAYGCDINEAKILAAADDLKSFGLQKSGYNYINIDDCWSVKDRRDPRTKRLLPDRKKFPRGIDGLVKDLHRRGFKVGIYADAGSHTCQNYPGSLGYEDIDAATFADWGIDYLKYDNCNIPAEWKDQYHNCHPHFDNPKGRNNTCVRDPRAAPKGYNWSKSKSAERFRRMYKALAKQDRTIVYSLCQWGQAGVTEWGASMAQSWRVTNDIHPWWSSITDIIKYSSRLLNSVDFYSHNDPDMLEVGNGNLTYRESKTHFALWAAMKSPLLIGTDLSSMRSSRFDILQNKYLLAFNQDSKQGKPATPFLWDWNSLPEYWLGKYGNGDSLVLVINYEDDTAKKSLQWGEIPGTKKGRSYDITDVWTGQVVKCLNWGLKMEVGGHDTVGVIVGKECKKDKYELDEDL